MEQISTRRLGLRLADFILVFRKDVVYFCPAIGPEARAMRFLEYWTAVNVVRDAAGSLRIAQGGGRRKRKHN